MAKSLKLVRIGKMNFVAYDNIDPAYFAEALMEQMLKGLGASEKTLLMSPVFAASIKKVTQQIALPVELAPSLFVESKWIDVTPWIESALGY